MRKIILALTMISTLAFAGDKVIIGAWGSYPVATGTILSPTQDQGKDTKYILPKVK